MHSRIQKGLETPEKSVTLPDGPHCHVFLSFVESNSQKKNANHKPLYKYIDKEIYCLFLYIFL